MFGRRYFGGRYFGARYFGGGSGAAVDSPATVANNLRICPINFLDFAILEATPAMETTMPITNVQLTARDKSSRSTSSADQSISGTWGGDAYKCDGFFMFRHNAQGGSIRLRLYPNVDYTGTPYDSGAVAISTAITSNSYDWGMPATGPDSANDLLLSESPYSLFFTTFTAKSFRIDLTNCQRSYWDVGRIFLGKYLEAPYNPKEGMPVGRAFGDISDRTKSGSLRTRAGAKWRSLRVDMFYFDDANRALWGDMISKIQKNRDVAISIFPGAGGRQERDHVINMQLNGDVDTAWSNVMTNQATYTFTEL